MQLNRIRIGFRMRALAAAMCVFAGRAYPLDVQVTFYAQGRAMVSILHRPDREPLAALGIFLKLKDPAGIRSVASLKPASGPWSQFLARSSLSPQGIAAFAMAPATGPGRDSTERLIAQFDLATVSSAGTRMAADLIDSVILMEAYDPEGKPLSLPSRLTTSVGRIRPRAVAPSLRERGNARTLVFNLGRAQRVRAWISDVRGRRVADVLDRKLSAGIQEATWDGKMAGGSLPARGTYLFHLEAGTFSYARKVEAAP